MGVPIDGAGSLYLKQRHLMVPPRTNELWLKALPDSRNYQSLNQHATTIFKRWREHRRKLKKLGIVLPLFNLKSLSPLIRERDSIQCRLDPISQNL